MFRKKFNVYACMCVWTLLYLDSNLESNMTLEKKTLRKNWGTRAISFLFSFVYVTNKIKKLVAMGSISGFRSTNSVPKKLKEYSLQVTGLTWVGNEEVRDTKTRSLQCTLWQSCTEYETIPGNLNRLILYAQGQWLVCLSGRAVSGLLTPRRRELWETAFATLSTITLRPERGFAHCSPPHHKGKYLQPSSIGSLTLT